MLIKKRPTSTLIVATDANVFPSQNGINLLINHYSVLLLSSYLILDI